MVFLVVQIKGQKFVAVVIESVEGKFFCLQFFFEFLNFFDDGFSEGLVPFLRRFRLPDNFVGLDEDELRLIIYFSLIFIVQGFIRLVNLVEFFAVVIRVVHVLVRMIFDGEFSECLLNLVRTRIERDSQNVVVVVLSIGLVLKIRNNVFLVDIVFVQIENEFLLSYHLVPELKYWW